MIDRRGLGAAAWALALLLASVPPAHAHRVGMTSDQFLPDAASGCNNAGCHSGGKPPAVVLSGPTLLAPGAVGTYTLSVHAIGKQVGAGFNVEADDGTFVVTDAVHTQLLLNPASLDDEITHTSVAATPAAGVTTFSFNWTAPPAAFGPVGFDAWGNAVNNDTGAGGDAATRTTLTVSDVNSVLCGSAPPINTCVTPAKSALVIKSTSAAKQGLTLVWSNGPTTAPGDFGDPVTTADYAVCLYADSLLAGDLNAPHGSAWTTKTNGFLFKDKTAPSLQGMTLLAGKTAGKAKIIAKGRGALALPPLLPFQGATSVTVQVINSQNGNCWADTYGSSQILKNGASLFKAKH